MTDWNINEAQKTYNIAHWGGGYFSVNEQGHLIAHPDRRPDHSGINLFQLVKELHAQNMTLPILVRFTDILRDRVDHLCNAFVEAMQEEEYAAKHMAIYPIKVNQQRSVVESIFQHGHGRVGLEAGSKPELMAVLALAEQQGGVIVCNGYKDREYIRLALIGRKLGHRIYIVIEKLNELELVIREAADLGIEPLLGFRVRLASIGAGKWQNSGGEKSKFGLSASQMLLAIKRLQQVNGSGWVKMLHFHLGSQIANIRDIQRGMREAARYFAELHRLGIDIDTVDVGGGLGIDYEGTRSRSYCSINYSLEEYAKNVVRALREICEQEALPKPNIFTESGRAMTAHHAVLITNIIDTDSVPDPQQLNAPADDAPSILQDMWYDYENLLQHQERKLSARSILEIYHDINHWLTEIQDMYNHGVVTLQQRAYAEEIYYAACRLVPGLLDSSSRTHREILDEVNEKLADKYFCNFSLFQSIPDVWAIDQVFPVVPIHRLNEKPTRRGVIEDITCDSDGRIDHYVDNEGLETSLPLHSYDPQQPYLLGIFLVGAYQEILGDLHNLFGDTDSIHVELNPDGSYRLSQPIMGDTVDKVLGHVNFDSNDLLQRYQQKLAQLAETDAVKQQYFAELEAGLHGYTYLED